MLAKLIRPLKNRSPLPEVLRQAAAEAVRPPGQPVLALPVVVPAGQQAEPAAATPAAFVASSIAPMPIAPIKRERAAPLPRPVSGTKAATVSGVMTNSLPAQPPALPGDAPAFR